MWILSYLEFEKLSVTKSNKRKTTYLGRCEKWKLWKLYCPQMKVGACHKYKILLEKDFFFNNAPSFAKKSAAPLKVKNLFWKKSWFMIVIRSVLVPRNQRKKLEFDLSYGYGAISDNVRKCTKWALFVHFGAFLLNTL